MIGVIGEPRKAGEKLALWRHTAISDIKDVIEFLSNDQGVPYLGILGSDVTEELTEQGIPAVCMWTKWRRIRLPWKPGSRAET